MFETLKNAIAAAEQIVAALSYEKSRVNNSIDYWTQQQREYIENNNGEISEYYETEIAREQIERDFIDAIEKLLVDKVQKLQK